MITNTSLSLQYTTLQPSIHLSSCLQYTFPPAFNTPFLQPSIHPSPSLQYTFPPVLYLTKTLVVETSYIAIIALVLLRECAPLTTVDLSSSLQYTLPPAFNTPFLQPSIHPPPSLQYTFSPAFNTPHPNLQYTFPPAFNTPFSQPSTHLSPSLQYTSPQPSIHLSLDPTNTTSFTTP